MPLIRYRAVPYSGKSEDIAAFLEELQRDLLSAPRTRSVVLVVPGNPAAAAIQSVRISVPQAGTITAIKSTCRVVVASGTYTYDVRKSVV